MERASVQEAIRTFIVEELLDNEGDGLTATAPLLEYGIIDSLSFVRLVHFLEKQFGVVLEGEVSMASFADLEAITDTVLRASTKPAG